MQVKRIIVLLSNRFYDDDWVVRKIGKQELRKKARQCIYRLRPLPLT